MQLSVIKCDCCPVSTESGEGWSKFTHAFGTNSLTEWDLCPDCVIQMQTAVGSVLHKDRLFEADEPIVPTTLDDAERRHIERVLQYTRGNKSQAARILLIERSTLDRKLKRYETSVANHVAKRVDHATDTVTSGSSVT